MKLKKVKQIAVSIIIGANMVLLAACGSSSSRTDMGEKTAVVEESYDMVADSAASTTSEAAPEADMSGIENTQELTNSISQISGQKLIKDVSMSVETKEFDSFIAELNYQIASLGGYVESSDVSGGSYEYESYRYGNIVARIPADRLEGFVKIVNEKGNVVHTSQQTTDVTLQYVDIESHLKALKLEQETLMNLLENATNMEDVIAIQSQLTQVRYEIESNESQIRTYDNLVNYSTVRISITEVERETQAEAVSFAGEIKVKLSNNLYAIKEGFRSLLIELIAALPYIIIWAVVIFIIIIIGRKVFKRYSKKALREIQSKESKLEETKKDENEDMK
jgi:hypothetical protein